MVAKFFSEKMKKERACSSARWNLTEKLLIVDDEEKIVEAVKRSLDGLGLDLFTAFDGKTALSILQKERPDLLLTDLRMPGLNGLELLEEGKKADPTLQVVMITGHGTVDDAVQAMKKGAYDFLQKPFKKQQLLAVVHRALEKSVLLRENHKLREKLRRKNRPTVEWGKSEVVKTLLQYASQAARSEATILILGESGTGKEVLANYIHRNSTRLDAPLVKVNCAAIPENLLEAELFGYKKGAFTGAYQDRSGKFQDAHGGSIFLDEIGDLPLAIQSKLLRVLQEGEVNPVGGHTERVDVRILAATNRDLRKLVKEDKFREDLFYRLNVIPLTMPPLRRHMDDLPALLSFFLSKYCRKNRRELLSLSPEALKSMEDYDWPGNVRELENAVERAVILSMGKQITAKDLPEELSAPCPGGHALQLCNCMTLEEVEQKVIALSLERHSGNKQKAAQDLGISLRTIYRKLDRL